MKADWILGQVLLKSEVLDKGRDVGEIFSKIFESIFSDNT